MGEKQKIGEVIITEDWGSDDTFRYAAHIRLPTELSTDDLDTTLSENIESEHDVREVIKKEWSDQFNDFLWEAIKKEYGTKIPAHKYIAYIETESHILKEELEREVTDALEDLIGDKASLCVIVKKIKRFPDETRKRKIPLTRGMIDNFIKKEGVK